MSFSSGLNQTKVSRKKKLNPNFAFTFDCKVRLPTLQFCSEPCRARAAVVVPSGEGRISDVQDQFKRPSNSSVFYCLLVPSLSE